MSLVREVLCRLSCMIETTCIVCGNHVRERVILLRHIKTSFSGIRTVLKVCRC